MNVIGRLLLLIGIATVATGCVQTRPLMSHAHIGHALTTWHDTPDRQGLYTVAAKELDIAIAATGQALAETTAPRRAGRHLRNALHALDPDAERFGSGLDYGAIRALQGAIEHLEYAADSDDASDNFVASVVTLVDQGDLVVARLIAARDALAAVDPADPASDPRLRTAERLLLAAKHGDPGGAATDGSLARADHGLLHVSAELAGMLRREKDPGYEPVPRKYVLGLVKLPNGRWGYRMPRTAYTSGGYRY